MSKANIDFNSISVGLGSVILIIISYIGFAIKAFMKDKDKDIKNLNDKVEKNDKDTTKKIDDYEKEIKEELRHQRTMHDDHYGFEKEIKPELSELKADCKNLKENVEKIDSEHRRNHNGRREE